MSQSDYITNLVGAFSLALSSGIEQQIAGLGLRSQSAASALVTIRNHPNDTIEVLRGVLKLTHSGAGRLVNGLEKDGLVVRRPNPEDSRAVTIRLTAKGKRQSERVLSARSELIGTVMQALDDEQKAALTPIMESALGSLAADIPGARRICRLCDECVCRPLGCPVEIAVSD